MSRLKYWWLLVQKLVLVVTGCSSLSFRTENGKSVDFLGAFQPHGCSTLFSCLIYFGIGYDGIMVVDVVDPLWTRYGKISAISDWH